MAGLPGCGKSSVAEALAKELRCAVLAADPVEASLICDGIPTSELDAKGYHILHAIAAEQLKLGMDVVIDVVNPVEEARQGWQALAKDYTAKLFFIECMCSNEKLHRERIANRVRNIAGMPETTWERVEERRREYAPWNIERLVLDSVEPLDEMVQKALSYVNEQR